MDSKIKIKFSPENVFNNIYERKSLKIMLTRLRIFNIVITIFGKELFENETDSSTTFLFSFRRSWSMLSSKIKTYLKTYLKTKEDNAKNDEEEKRRMASPRKCL